MSEELVNLSANEVSAPVSGLDQFAVQELVEYIMGSSAEPPKALDKMMTNLYQKLQTGLGYSVASNVQRQAKLVKFISEVESEIFDPERVKDMEEDKLVDLYTKATKTLSEMNEFERRFLAQNKDAFSSHKTEQEKIAQKLMTLSPEKLESIMKIIQGESLVESNESVEDILGEEL